MELHRARKFEEIKGQNLFSLFSEDLEETQVRLLTLNGRCKVNPASSQPACIAISCLFPSPFLETNEEHMLQTARIAPLFAGEKICGVVLVIEDVTQRESQAQTLHRQHRRDELLSWTLAQLLNSDRPRKEVRQLFFKVVEQLDLDTFLVYFGDVPAGTLTLDAAGGIPPELENDFIDCPFLKVLSRESTEATVLNSIQTHKEPEYAAPSERLAFQPYSDYSP